MSELTDILPEGFSARTNTMEEIPELLPLFNGMTMHFMGIEEDNVESITTFWKSRLFKIDEWTHTVYDTEGKPVGHGTLWYGLAPSRPFLWLRVDPAYIDTTVTDYIAGWAESVLSKTMQALPGDIRVCLITVCDQRATPLVKKLEGLGYSQFRFSHKMLITMDYPPEKPIYPAGLEIRPFAIQQAETLYKAKEAVFKDHFGYIERPFEKGLANFLEQIKERPNADPDNWIIIWHEDEIAGFCLVDKYHDGIEDEGYIGLLGVTRPWRKKSLGLAMLKQAFREFYQRGKMKVSLHVDGLSLTGATRLYEKAGMKIDSTELEFEKELRPGRELATQELEE
ncbi:MAG: GNAT family N-acetyltransferase [Anaerolineales bacterium]|nr:GNAT family N-acetyltransferase [Anaerolineales bacterium]